MIAAEEEGGGGGEWGAGGSGGGGDDGGGGSNGNSGVTVLSLAQGLGLEFVPLSALQFLDAPDIARSGAANRFMYKAAGDEGVWRAARDRLWERKVFVPKSSRAMSSAKAGYIDSLRDSMRTWLEPEELTSFCWWFRFKQQAGEAWTAQDPWYRNEKVGGWCVREEVQQHVTTTVLLYVGGSIVLVIVVLFLQLGPCPLLAPTAVLILTLQVLLFADPHIIYKQIHRCNTDQLCVLVYRAVLLLVYDR